MANSQNISRQNNTNNREPNAYINEDLRESVPDDPPPPYSEVANGNTEVTADANFQRPFVALNQQFERASSASSQDTNLPPPIPRRPLQRPSNPSNIPYHGGSSNNVTFDSHQESQQFQKPQKSRVPWAYPPGYWCPKCNNTGIKIKNGLSCQDCYARFARQHANIYQSYSNTSSFSPWTSQPSRDPTIRYGPSPIVVQPGDPRIGGILCGRCRGKGVVWDLLMESTCPTCKGVGRLF